MQNGSCKEHLHWKALLSPTLLAWQLLQPSPPPWQLSSPPSSSPCPALVQYPLARVNAKDLDQLYKSRVRVLM
jgi:hypothetical protein